MVTTARPAPSPTRAAARAALSAVARGAGVTIQQCGAFVRLDGVDAADYAALFASGWLPLRDPSMWRLGLRSGS